MSEHDDRSVAELQAMGFTYIRAHCGSCNKVTHVYLSYLLSSGAAAVSTRFREITPRLRCDRCGIPPSSVRPDCLKTSGGNTYSQTKKDPATNP